MKKKQYDFIFGIGEACSCTEVLRRSGLQFASYPFDWLFGADFNKRVDILLSSFSRWLGIRDLIYLHCNNGDTKNLCDIYKNEYTGIVFNHDFPAGVPLEKSFEAVAGKYKRRINRLLAEINKAKKILIVCIETPNCAKSTSDEEILDGYLKLNAKYSNKGIDLIYLKNDASLKVPEYQRLNANVLKIKADYKNKSLQALPYQVNHKFLCKILHNYRLKLPFMFRIKIYFLKTFISFIPISKYRKSLRKKYHV